MLALGRVQQNFQQEQHAHIDTSGLQEDPGGKGPTVQFVHRSVHKRTGSASDAGDEQRSHHSSRAQCGSSTSSFSDALFSVWTLCIITHSKHCCHMSCDSVGSPNGPPALFYFWYVPLGV